MIFTGLSGNRLLFLRAATVENSNAAMAPASGFFMSLPEIKARTPGLEPLYGLSNKGRDPRPPAFR